MNKAVILDASALLALLQKENGSSLVEKNLSCARISSINFSEVLAVLMNIGMSNEEAKASVIDLVAEVISFDEEQAYLTAQLKVITKKYGLSLGDRACIALGQLQKKTILTADKAWNNLNLKNVHIELIR